MGGFTATLQAALSFSLCRLFSVALLNLLEVLAPFIRFELRHLLSCLTFNLNKLLPAHQFIQLSFTDVKGLDNSGQLFALQVTVNG